MADDPDSEILLEMNRIRGAMEVRAVSAADGLEVVFTAPSNAAQSDIERLARQKLAYVRGKARGGGGPERPSGKGGLIA
jgi:predicted metal-dependent hydrolase